MPLISDTVLGTACARIGIDPMQRVNGVEALITIITFGQIPSNLYIGLLDQPIAFPLASVSAADGIQSKVCAGIAKLKENFQS